MLVAGARPNFMKVAPIWHELVAKGIDAAIVHTGQHYDTSMSDFFFRDLSLPQPHFYLDVGSASHAQQTARIMERFEPVLLDYKPNWLVVVGDVNSTLACALVAAKLQTVTQTRIAHVEAGLRSYDWRMPEEINRVLTDRLADLLLTPSVGAADNLAKEGISAEKIRFVGNVMIDTLFASLPAARGIAMPTKLGLAQREYGVLTLHRPSNVDVAEQLNAIVDGIATFSKQMPVVFPAHPRTKARLQECKALENSRIRVIEPLGYLEMLSLVDASAIVMTDSGGLQEETTALGVPCLTLREQTERPITITEGTNQLVSWPIIPSELAVAAASAVQKRSGVTRKPEGWDGIAAQRIVQALSHGTRW